MKRVLPLLLALILLAAGLSAAPAGDGEELFTWNCATCHGPRGHGDGPSAPTLEPVPADLAGELRYGSSPTALFRTISEGVHGTAMPPFGERLPEGRRWELVRYVLTIRGEWPGTPDDACRAQDPEAP